MHVTSTRFGSAYGLRTLGFAVAGAALLALSAQVRVPMWPVPMTMQTAAALFIGGALPLSGGLAAVGLYLALATAGLPVLAAGGTMGGPTTGYLIGFVVAIAMLGALRPRGPWLLLAALLGAQAALYACGLAWLIAFWAPTPQAAVFSGLLPFLVGDALKIALAFALLLALREPLRHRRGA